NTHKNQSNVGWAKKRQRRAHQTTPAKINQRRVGKEATATCPSKQHPQKSINIGWAKKRQRRAHQNNTHKNQST
ncbi:MAG: hypothetical protein Q8L68_04040, partial [Methylococcales bacterium]|nr:hypothetical protein [Methylococcales bacterium]